MVWDETEKYYEMEEGSCTNCEKKPLQEDSHHGGRSVKKNLERRIEYLNAHLFIAIVPQE